MTDTPAPAVKFRSDMTVELIKATASDADVVWAAPPPGGIADALAATVVAPGIQSRAQRAAAGVRRGWGVTGKKVATLILSEIHAGSVDRTPADDGQRRPPVTAGSELTAGSEWRGR